MTRRSIRIVSLQAAVVGVLLVVVYLTLLAPEKNEPLFDVSVPPEPSQLAPQKPNGHREHRQEHRGEPHPKPNRPPRVPQPAAPLAPAAIGLGAAETPTAVVPPPEGTETPTGDQYDDAVARVLDRL